MSNYSPLLVIGPSGSGKSYSLRNLDGPSTLVLDLERKPMPFAHDMEILPIDSGPRLLKVELPKALKSDKKVIVIDSLTEWCWLYKKAMGNMYKGYDIYKFYAEGIFDLLQMIKACRDKFFVVFSRDEVYDIMGKDGIEGSYRVANLVEGNKLRGQVEPNFTTVAFTSVQGKGRDATYHFTTWPDGTTAKAPPALDMPDLVDNDVDALLKKMAILYGVDYKSKGER